ncbi:YkvS family protein [Lysinibacillus xylanilyticus]|uniref:DUF2187 family protein n=1 Tax=Lysinibacillus xylanilyticus TaxID=582475 RepID=UPI002B24DE73|nr:DUF2187 family protein [Lysinibacillus xylanilyticus]MEB2280215.1 YkvS family protein [Lysinibacillus xylanilyticus]
MLHLSNSWDMQQVKCLPKKLKRNHASHRDTIEFERNGLTIQGLVATYREHTVLVSISDSDAAKLHLESPITLVNHKKKLHCY